MTDRGDFILIDTSELGAAFSEILKTIDSSNRRVRVVRDGKAVAEISAITPPHLAPSSNPKLQGSISPDYLTTMLPKA